MSVKLDSSNFDLLCGGPRRGLSSSPRSIISALIFRHNSFSVSPAGFHFSFTDDIICSLVLSSTADHFQGTLWTNVMAITIIAHYTIAGVMGRPFTSTHIQAV